MKVMMYFFSLDRSSGGAERMLHNLAEGMHLRGHQVQLVSWDEPAAELFYPLSSEIHWNKLGSGDGLVGKIWRTARLIRLLWRERPDLFIGFVMGADKSIYAANLLCGVRLVAAERNSPTMYRMRLSRLKTWFYFQLFRLCHGITVQFESYRQGYPKRLHGRIAVIPNPVRIASIQAKPGQSARRYMMLSVGRLSNQKRFDILIDAFYSIASRFPDWDLRILGAGTDRAALEASIDKYGLEKRVDVPGTMTDVEKAYAEAHLFVLPSRWEGFPNALAEALAHGLPAVGFADCPGVNELIVNGDNGLLAKGIDDSHSLAAALAELMDNAELRQVMGEKAKASMAGYCQNIIYDQWESFLRQCATVSRRQSWDMV